MFVARYENTMRNAQPKIAREDRVVVRTMDEVREEKRRQFIDEQAEKRRAEFDRINEKIRARRAEFERRMEANARQFEADLAQMYGHTRPTFASITARACRVFKVSRTELLSDRRHTSIIHARQFVMYWAYRLTTLSLPQIGARLGGRDHTTVLYGVRKYPERRAAMGRHLRKAR